MGTMEDRVKRLEIENLTIRENIWDLTRRFALVEQLVRSHILHTGNDVPVDRLFGSMAQARPDSATMTELCNRLSSLEMLVQNLAPHQKAPMPNGNSPFVFQDQGIGNNNTPFGPPVFPQFRPVPPNMYIPVLNPGVPNSQGGENFQRAVAPPVYQENNNKDVLEKFLLSGTKQNTHPIIMTHPKTVDKYGQDFPPIKPSGPGSGGGGGGGGEEIKEKSKQPIVLSVEPKKTPCTKLCGKLTAGHICGQTHATNTACPPCQVLQKDLKLKCGHKADLKCHLRNSPDFKCHQCESAKNIPSKQVMVSKPASEKSTPFSPPFTTEKAPIVEPLRKGNSPPPPPIEVVEINSSNQSAPLVELVKVEEQPSWLDVAWGDEEDDFPTSIPPPPVPKSSSNDTKKTDNNIAPPKPSVAAAVTQKDVQPLKPIPVVDPTPPPAPLSYVQSLTMNSSRNSASSTRTNSPASSISGSSASAPKFNVELIVQRWWKVNAKPKVTRKEWISHEFKNFTNVLLQTFLRHLTRYAVKLTRGQMAAVGQLIAGIIETNLTSMDLVIQAYLSGIIADLPKIQKEDASKFELVGDNVCYLLLANFTEDKNLNWLVILGTSLKETKPGIWALMSTSLIHLIQQRRKDKGLRELYASTTMDNKLAVLSQAMQAVNIRV